MYHWIIFDFSGTLSLQAARFGESETLTKALKSSGLWQMGLNRLDVFWNQLIGATWKEGATTPIGYASLLTGKLSQMLQAPEADIFEFVSQFARLYFQHSAVESAWIPLLQKLIKHPDVTILIATDHYADATEQIIFELSKFNLQAVRLSAARSENGTVIFIANSANIGHLKAGVEFWEIVKKCQSLPSPVVIHIVDDFGCNEPGQDSYAAKEKIAARREQTTSVLTHVFGCTIRVFPFFLEDINKDAAALRAEVRSAIKAISDQIQEALP